METALVIVMFGLVSGAYTFTWAMWLDGRKSRKDLWAAITEIRINAIKHIEERLDKLEGK